MADPTSMASHPLPQSMPRPSVYHAGPQPKKFATSGVWQLLAVTAASVPAIIRLGTGLFVHGYKLFLEADDGKYAVAKYRGHKLAETSDASAFKRPAQPLELYEFESCPYCKKVREAFSILDLDVLVRPCPKFGVTWRPQAARLGGKRQFPFLVDPNTGKQMYESDDIIRYLFNEYGPGEAQIPFMLRAGALTTLTCTLGLLPRTLMGRGLLARTSSLPEQPLRVWLYEASSFAKLVREVLCELELPYLQMTAARGSPKRQEMLEKYGHFQVPFLEDPNTGQCMFESAFIIEYLNKTYGARKSA